MARKQSEAELALESLREMFLQNRCDIDIADHECIEPAFKLAEGEWRTLYSDLKNDTLVVVVYDLKDATPTLAMRRFPGCLVGNIRNLSIDKDSPNSLYYKFRIKLTPACRALLVAGKADNPDFAWDLDESKFLESSAYQVFAGDGLLDEISERMAPWASEETPQVRYMCVFSNAPRRGFNFSQSLFLALHVDPRQKTGKGKTQDEAAGGQSQCQ